MPLTRLTSYWCSAVLYPPIHGQWCWVEGLGARRFVSSEPTLDSSSWLSKTEEFDRVVHYPDYLSVGFASWGFAVSSLPLLKD